MREGREHWAEEGITTEFGRRGMLQSGGVTAEFGRRGVCRVGAAGCRRCRNRRPEVQTHFFSKNSLFISNCEETTPAVRQGFGWLIGRFICWCGFFLFSFSQVKACIAT